ncbi:PDR/VanB family oxidoreductase [Nocardia mangyaensis]|uniref:PDR/VanB family oxidoreductase n=1 Tax=Nocardia mangyaensis TaxID=2213200 RepID=UPI002675454F|nr:PDR/VanB family oxidoreductase [Nocardia mangyaensis]MDO3648383.1 PDR/VanB family oxidoreductase [Nocardia mangyaensis]
MISAIVRIRSISYEAEGVLSFVLIDPAGAPLPPWEPGAHVDVVLPDGVVRQYSLCGDPGDRDSYRIAVLLEEQGRGGSAWLHEKVRPGTLLEIREPRNNFPLAAADRYVLIAGGIGITPLLPMMRELDRRGAAWQLHYGGRSGARMAFAGELAAYGERVRRYPQDECGLIPLAEILDPVATGTLVYCCGPEPLLDAVEKSCAPDVLRVERFHPREIETGPDRPMTVVLRRSGRTIEVPAEETVLDALERAGADVLWSCREGTCATCETPVLEGEIDHRDSILTPQERESGETMMICVSRARTDRLVLDA